MTKPKDNKPKGKLTVDKVDMRQTSDVAVYFDIYLKDEEGSIYKCHSSSFLYSLEKVEKKGKGDEQTTTSQKHLPKRNAQMDSLLR
jgi:hypothetical protein